MKEDPGAEQAKNHLREGKSKPETRAKKAAVNQTEIFVLFDLLSYREQCVAKFLH